MKSKEEKRKGRRDRKAKERRNRRKKCIEMSGEEKRLKQRSGKK